MHGRDHVLRGPHPGAVPRETHDHLGGHFRFAARPRLKGLRRPRRGIEREMDTHGRATPLPDTARRFARDNFSYREQNGRITGFDRGHSRDRLRAVLPPPGGRGERTAVGVRFRRGRVACRRGTPYATRLTAWADGCLANGRRADGGEPVGPAHGRGALAASPAPAGTADMTGCEVTGTGGPRRGSPCLAGPARPGPARAVAADRNRRPRAPSPWRGGLAAAARRAGAGLTLLLLAVLFAVPYVSPAQAQLPNRVLVSNLDQPTNSSDSSYSLGLGLVLAQKFTVEANNDYTLTDVTVDVQVIGTSGRLSAAIHEPTGANPADAALYALTAPSSFPVSGSYTFTAPANATLEKGESYFVVITGDADEATDLIQINAIVSDGEDSDGISGWSIANAGRHFNTARWANLNHSRAVKMRLRGAATTITATLSSPESFLRRNLFYRFELSLSEAVAIPYGEMRDHAFGVTNGHMAYANRIHKVRRTEGGRPRGNTARARGRRARAPPHPRLRLAARALGKRALRAPLRGHPRKRPRRRRRVADRGADHGTLVGARRNRSGRRRSASGSRPAAGEWRPVRAGRGPG